MLNNIRCNIPQGVERQKEKSKFIRNIVEEERRVKVLHAQEIQSTAENPRIRVQNETTDISRELGAQKRERFLEEKRRQRLRENNMDLRQLGLQLRAALVRKQLAEQKGELERQHDEKLRAKRQENIDFERERVRSQELQREEEIKERRKKEAFRSILQGQMAEKRERRSKEYEDILKDRDQMHKMLQQFEAEHADEMKELELRKQRSKEEMNEIIRLQELEKLRMKAEKLEEKDTFSELCKQSDIEKYQREAEKQKERQRKQEQSEKIGQQLYKIQSEKKRREDLLLDLLVEERKTKEDFRFRQNLEKQNQERIQVRNELERYRQEILIYKEKRQKEEEQQLLAAQYQLKAEHDKLDQLATEKHRQKLQEHKNIILDMIEERRRRRIEETTTRLQEYELALENERSKNQEIEDERIRMLRNQPAELLRYLPVGVLREGDREFLALSPSKEKK